MAAFLFFFLFLSLPLMHACYALEEILRIKNYYFIPNEVDSVELLHKMQNRITNASDSR